MNKRLFRTQFNQMENIEKQVLMESLAARYDMTFRSVYKELHADHETGAADNK